MGKLKLFLENFLVYGLGGIINKIIPLVMIPIITRLMPDSTYVGISDLSNTLISFTSSLAVMGMYDAMYRMFFEKDEKEFQLSICSTAFAFTIVTSIFVFILMIIFRTQISLLFFQNKGLSFIVYISAMATLIGSTNQILAAPTRMQNKRIIFLITNVASSVCSYAIAIPLLLSGYYVIALPLAGLISVFILEIVFIFLNKNWFNFRKVNYSLLKSLLYIAIPLMPNFLIYWIFNSCDRIMITNMMDIGAAGIYSIGSKLGHASQLIYTAFAGGWQFFAFSTMKEDNQVKSNSLIFEYLGIISFIATTFICSWSNMIYNILFVGEYVEGYIVAPYLFLAPLLQMLFQVACNQFLVIKKTWPNMLILSTGAILNIIINFFLIPALGIEGAAIATLAGYIVSDIVCVVVLCKMKLMVISSRFIFSSVVMAVFMICWRLYFTSNILVGTILSVFVTLLYMMLYMEELTNLFHILRKKREG